MEAFLVKNSQLILGSLLTLFSSLVSICITKYFAYRESKQVLEFNFKKEIYYKLQDRAYDIIAGIERFRDKINQFSITLRHKTFSIDDYNNQESKKEFNAHKEKLAINVGIYFPELIDDYSDFAKSYIGVVDLFFKIVKQSEIKEEDKKIIASMKKFSEKSNDLVKKIIDLLNEKKEEFSE